VPKDSTLYIRAAVLTALKAAAGVIALVPGARIYPQQRPADPDWPFIAYGSPIAVPFGAACLDGSAITVAIHCYAATTGEGEDTVPGEDLATEINAAVAAALGDATLELEEAPYPATAHVDWTGSQVMQDGAEADAFHGFSTFQITVSS
jgi:hypothetical protein